MIKGQLLQGATAAACEFGHIVLHPGGKACRCGNAGCWERYTSDLALCQRYAEAGGRRKGNELDAAFIVKKAREGEPMALRVLDGVARDLGLGFASLIVVFNPEAILVGDYLADAWELIEETVWAVVRSGAPRYFSNELRILPSRYKADGPLMGAVALVLTSFFNSFDHSSRATPANSVSIRASA
jgi:predicted NBD/HSP70 family sugar kinase